MPRIRRLKLPELLFAHLVKRVRERQIASQQLAAFSDWLAIEPIVPEGKWFKRFPRLTSCGEGELIKPSCSRGNFPLEKRSDRPSE